MIHPHQLILDLGHRSIDWLLLLKFLLLLLGLGLPNGLYGHLLLLLDLLQLIGQIIKNLIFTVFFGVEGRSLVRAVLMGDVTALLDEQFAHLEVAFTG
jgi:hypothetical protein